MVLAIDANIKKVKKRTKKFIRFNSDRFLRVKEAWRRPRGIDNRCRRRFRGNRPMPKIGYRTAKDTRYKLKDGFLPVLLRNIRDIEMLTMCNRTYCGVIHHAVGAKVRAQIVTRAAELNVKIQNAKARLQTQEVA